MKNIIAVRVLDRHNMNGEFLIFITNSTEYSLYLSVIFAEVI